MVRGFLSFSLVALAVAAGCNPSSPDTKSALHLAATRTLSSFEPPNSGGKTFPSQAVKFEQAELAQVLNLYAAVSGRSMICAGNLPQVRVTFTNQTPMTSVEIRQALDTALALQGVITVVLGTQYVKVVAAKQAHLESPPVLEREWQKLPDSSSYLTYIVQLKNVPHTKATAVLQSFASELANTIMAIGPESRTRLSSQGTLPKLANTIFPGNDDSILILRDYSSHVRRMLQVLEKLEQQ
jgi:hypothetical protein